MAWFWFSEWLILVYIIKLVTLFSVWKKCVIWSAVFEIKWRYDPRTCWTWVRIPLSHLNFSGLWDNCLNCPASARIISSFDFKHRTSYNTFLSYYIPFTGKHEPNKLTCSQLCDFVAQLVRALHRHRRGHGFRVVKGGLCHVSRKIKRSFLNSRKKMERFSLNKSYVAVPSMRYGWLVTENQTIHCSHELLSV